MNNNCLLLVVYFIFFFNSLIFADTCSEKFGITTNKILKESYKEIFWKELDDVIECAKTNSEFSIIHDTFVFMLDYFIKRPVDVYNLCSKTKLDCTYFKAKLLESQGNAGSAVDLYIRAGFYTDLIRIRAMDGKDFSDYLKFENVSERNKYYYLGLSFFKRGDWNNAIKYFSRNVLDNDIEAIFFLGKSMLMLGKIDDVKEIISKKNKKLNYYQKNYINKLEALILYYENKVENSYYKFKKLFDFNPYDNFVKKYLAQTSYRLGLYDDAEKIYKELIGKTWSDTDLYYLLKEQCFIDIRYLNFNLAKKTALKIIKEYPDKKEFVSELISLLIEYDNVELASSFLNYLKENTASFYEKSLFYFAKGMLSEVQIKDKDALSFYSQAMSVYSSPEYKYKVDLAKSNLKQYKQKKYKMANCKEYNVKNIGEKKWSVESNKFGVQYPVKYLVKQKNKDKYEITLNLLYKHSDLINFEHGFKKWNKYLEKFWSKHGIDLRINQVDKFNTNFLNTNVNVFPWISYFFNRRITSHEWNILAPYRVIAHELGHLLGLDDEYVEMNEKLKYRNKTRYIGERESIMRNILSGFPQKRHILFILSPLKCAEV